MRSAQVPTRSSVPALMRSSARAPTRSSVPALMRSSAPAPMPSSVRVPTPSSVPASRSRLRPTPSSAPAAAASPTRSLVPAPTPLSVPAPTRLSVPAPMRSSVRAPMPSSVPDRRRSVEQSGARESTESRFDGTSHFRQFRRRNCCCAWSQFPRPEVQPDIRAHRRLRDDRRSYPSSSIRETWREWRSQAPDG